MELYLSHSFDFYTAAMETRLREQNRQRAKSSFRQMLDYIDWRLM